MKKLISLLFIAFALVVSCNVEYDDTELRGRIENLELWQESVNTQLAALQKVVSALESSDYITGVEELADGSGYIISFLNSGSITIYHGTDGNTPIVDVCKDTDGIFYWTLNGEWLLDENNNKIPVTGSDGKDGQDGVDGQDGSDGKDGQDGVDGQDGSDGVDGQDGSDGKDGQDGIDGQDGVDGQDGADGKDGQDGIDGQDGADGKDGQDGIDGQDGADGQDGIDGQNGADGQDAVAPQVRINESTNEWEISTDGGVTWTSTGVNATGESSTSTDPIFTYIDLTDPTCVTFYLFSGGSITIPRTTTQLVEFEETGAFEYSALNTTVVLEHPTTLSDGDIQAIFVKVSNNSGTAQNLVTRAVATADMWGVEAVMPTFNTNGSLATNGYVVLNAPTSSVVGDEALLDIEILDKSGVKTVISRIIEIVASEAPTDYTSKNIDVENSTYSNQDMPDATDGVAALTSSEVSCNNQAISGGINYIELNTSLEYKSFNVCVDGVAGYFNIDASNIILEAGSSAAYSYRIPVLFGSGFDGDIVIFVSGVTLEGGITPHYKIEIMYVETAVGELAINLAFNNAKDIDLHLIEPDGNRIYYGNKMSVKDSDGNLIYGLDNDSNAGCYIDNLNNENIVVASDYMQNGTYRVIVDLYSNCDSSIATQWNAVVRYKGVIIPVSTGTNPASGIYEIGASNSSDDNNVDDDIANTGSGRVVMTFEITDVPTNYTLESLVRSRSRVIKTFDPSIEK